MGTGKKGFKRQGKDWTATELFGDAGGSEARQIGRRLTLRFLGKSKPELDRAEFHALASCPRAAYIQQRDPEHSFTWTRVPQALSLLFLEYLCAALEGREADFCFRGARTASLAASLGDAMGKNTGILYDLFKEAVGTAEATRLKWVLDGHNLHGKEDNERRIIVRSEYLPADCVEVFWEGKPLITPEALRAFGNNIRQAWELEPSQQPDPPPKVEPKQATPAEDKPPVKPRSALATSEPASSPKPEPEPSAKQSDAKTDNKTENAEKEPASPPLPRIDPNLFLIHNPDQLAWSDHDPLVDLGDDTHGPDYWRLRDACEGALILGMPASGKTSASGFMLSQSFLTAGFGGLVMTAKTDEARRWQKLCARAGRSQDCVVINADSPHKLNLLAYETQRPGKRVGVTKDLINFFRTLIAIVSRESRHKRTDPFWVNSTNDLMEKLFEVFQLAGEPLSIDALNHFLNKAPRKRTEQWQTLPCFGRVLTRAKEGIKNAEDQRIFDGCREYWTETFPNIADATRSGIVTGFTSMAATLMGRGLYELVCAETTLTPESILSGKIVILDLPSKGDDGEGGLLVQSAWKYLLQRAIERRADKGLETARPVFLWEDEGHLFFSQHDVEFQPTARDCRCAHVVISQNLHNFFQLGHNPDAVKAVFSSMNTHIFHANGDLETNKWASERIGTTARTLVNVSLATAPKQEPKTGFWDSFKSPEHQTTATTSVNEHFDRAFRPESFTSLKRGGDGYCQAVILWAAHRFKGNGGQPYCCKVLEQGKLD
jgi:hypothetical protein